jgi:ABC-type transport system substrate-binding protein
MSYRNLHFYTVIAIIVLTGMLVSLATCSEQPSSPHDLGAAAENTLYTAFTGRSPKTLDPTSSYASDETPFTYSIYEPPLNYHYLKRPYALIAGSTDMPVVQWFDAKGKSLNPTKDDAALAKTSVYTLKVKPNIRFQPHPAFALNVQGAPLYHHLTPAEIDGKYSPHDFAKQGTRTLTAHDFAYSIKRLATLRVPSPVFGHLAEYIVGLKALGERLKIADKALLNTPAGISRDKPFLDLRQFDLSGVKVLDEHTLTITLNGVYPQFKYWLAMTFFAPIPWEAEAFYSQNGMAAHNLSLAQWPVGTGAYSLYTSLTNRQHVLKRNPNYRGGFYPCEGDTDPKLLNDCGKATPFIDRIVFDLEREAVPLEAKFLGGYYDLPEAQRGEYGSAYLVAIQDATEKGNVLKSRNISLPSHVDTSVYYLGFNWLDPVVGQGGDSASQARNRALRQAISIAFDMEEYVALFEASQAHIMQSPIPPGLFGYRAHESGLNPTVYSWDKLLNKPKRKSITEAKRLMVEAGYPDGRSAKTGQPLILYLDVSSSASAAKAQYEWQQKQFAKLGIQLDIRSTDYNRFQDKMRKGAAQLFEWGWNADYPDAENFLFLLYGAHAKALNDGENASNYYNPAFDAAFIKMKSLENGPKKQALIDEMVQLLQIDCPWIWGRAPMSAGAYHQWVHNGKPTQQVRNVLQYYRLDTDLRVAKQSEWNSPRFAWLGASILLLLLSLGWVRRSWRKQQSADAYCVPPLNQPATIQKGKQ